MLEGSGVKPMRAGIRQISVMRKQLLAFTVIFLIGSAVAFAQKNVPHGAKGTVVHVANLYVQADESADKVSSVTPGRELVIAEHSGKWVRVFANTDVEVVTQSDAPVFGTETNARPISGWIMDKGVVSSETPNGDQILF